MITTLQTVTDRELNWMIARARQYVERGDSSWKERLRIVEEEKARRKRNGNTGTTVGTVSDLDRG